MPLTRVARSPFWWYDFYFEGKRYRRSTGETVKGAAAAVEAKFLTSLIQGSSIAPQRSHRSPTLREFSERFLTWVTTSRTLKDNTRKYYTYGWRLLSFSPLASMLIDQITAESVDCTAFQRPVLDRRTGRPTGQLALCSASYTAQALRTLKVMLGMAAEWNVVPRRPGFAVPKSPGRSRLIGGAEEAQLEVQLIKPVKHSGTMRLRFQAWLVWVILNDAGMRPFEVYRMQLQDLHWEQRRIWIPASKSAKGVRFVGMSERMHEMLAVWTHGDPGPGWVFPSRRKRSKTGHLTSIAVGFKSARDRAGLDPRIVPYTARHTFGTYTLRATKNIFAVSAGMGHADLKSMQPYQHQEIDELVEAVNTRNQSRPSIFEAGHTICSERRPDLLWHLHAIL